MVMKKQKLSLNLCMVYVNFVIEIARAGKAGLGWYHSGTQKPSYHNVKKSVYEVWGTGGHGEHVTSVCGSKRPLCVTHCTSARSSSYYQAMTAWEWLS